VAYYIFNSVTREPVAELLRVALWGVGEDEPHRDALAAGDLVLIYLAAPAREFVGRAELAAPVHAWTPSEAGRYPGDASSGVALAEVEEWEPPVAMQTVLDRLDASAKAKADFDVGVVRITDHEYETAVAVAAERAASTG
jgi:hypothetical protein